LRNSGDSNFHFNLFLNWFLNRSLILFYLLFLIEFISSFQVFRDPHPNKKVPPLPVEKQQQPQPQQPVPSTSSTAALSSDSNPSSIKVEVHLKDRMIAGGPTHYDTPTMRSFTVPAQESPNYHVTTEFYDAVVGVLMTKGWPQ
jgi:hypothetical protein